MELEWKKVGDGVKVDETNRNYNLVRQNQLFTRYSVAVQSCEGFFRLLPDATTSTSFSSAGSQATYEAIVPQQVDRAMRIAACSASLGVAGVIIAAIAYLH